MTPLENYTDILVSLSILVCLLVGTMKRVIFSVGNSENIDCCLCEQNEQKVHKMTDLMIKEGIGKLENPA